MRRSDEEGILAAGRSFQGDRLGAQGQVERGQAESGRVYRDGLWLGGGSQLVRRRHRGVHEVRASPERRWLTMPRPPSDWISLSEAAQLLASSNVRFTPGTIGRWARGGQLQSIKLGNRRFVRKAQVRSLLRPRGSLHDDDLQAGLFEDLDD